MQSAKFFVVGLNPEPWAVGPLGVGRKGKISYPYIGPNQKLQAYQEALREQLEGSDLLEGEVEITLYIWRKIETMKVYGGRDRKAKTSDATNIQKATEDAIQGVLIENDRNVRRITTEIVQQDENAEPCIVISVAPYQGSNPGFPDEVWHQVDVATKRVAPAPLFVLEPDDYKQYLPKEEDIF
jgi:hypothetical protein